MTSDAREPAEELIEYYARVLEILRPLSRADAHLVLDAVRTSLRGEGRDDDRQDE